MELQWPLILFTTFVAWSAGLFATQCVLALKGESAKAQMPAWAISAALLAVGGIAVFFHLEHWERIFNGFGRLSSGITQELIAIVVLAVVAVVYLAMLRKAGEGAGVPKWCAVLGVVASAVLVLVMAHSYMMAARPAWNTCLWVLAVLGNACVLGPATMVVICSIVNGAEKSDVLDKAVFAGSIANAATTVVYLISLATIGSSFGSVGYYFDPSRPTEGMVDIASVTNPFAGDNLVFTLISLLVVAFGIAAAFLGKKNDDWRTWGTVAVACGLVAAVCIRVVFYQMGASACVIY